MWSYADLKAADAALGLADPVEAASALNAQTVTVVRDIPTADARAILLLNGEWFKVKQLAKLALTGTAQDQAIAAADIAVDTLTVTSILRTADAGQWAAMQPMMGALLAAGAISAESVAAWSAMRSPAVPKWTPPPTEHDVTYARTL